MGGEIIGDVQISIQALGVISLETALTYPIRVVRKADSTFYRIIPVPYPLGSIGTYNIVHIAVFTQINLALAKMVELQENVVTAITGTGTPFPCFIAII